MRQLLFPFIILIQLFIFSGVLAHEEAGKNKYDYAITKKEGAVSKPTVLNFGDLCYEPGSISYNLHVTGKNSLEKKDKYNICNLQLLGSIHSSSILNKTIESSLKNCSSPPLYLKFRKLII